MKQGLCEHQAGNCLPGKCPKTGPENPYKQGLQNPKHGKHASQVGDGYLIVLAFEVLISLEFKIGQMHFLKGPKKGQN
jgi:hypothetical protein